LYCHCINPPWGNQLDLCVKRGHTFGLLGGQTWIMGPHWDSCYICYPAVPPRDLVPAPVPLPPHILTLPSPLVTAIPLGNPTPDPVDPALSQCPCTSAYPQMPQWCYRTDSILSCYANGRKYSIGNSTTNSYWGYADPVCPAVTGLVCWLSNPNNWLESLPQPNRTYDLDPWIYKLLNSTHHLLNYTSSLAKNCWVCLSPSLSQVLVTPWTHLELHQVKYWAFS
jgi:hypothetical protein